MRISINHKILPKAVIIYGLGRAGKTVSQFLLDKGVKVFAYDDNPEIQEEATVRKLRQNPNFKFLPKPNSVINQTEIDMIIVSPGVSAQAPLLQTLKNKKIPIIDEIEFTAQFIAKPIIAITGTNGKSTTTALIASILTTDGKNVFAGGNLAPGQPFSSALLADEKDFYVVEVSSFQLERCYSFSPHIALLLNITEDHFDRHHSKEEYVALKFRLVAHQKKNDFAIVNFDDPIIKANLNKIPAKTFYFSIERVVDGTYCQDEMIYYQGEPVLSVAEIKIPGKHNLKNVLAAICATKIIGVENSSIEAAITKFTGLPHRLELIREIDGIRYINNSMCTNPEAAINSLQAVPKPIILITGGKEKKLEIADYLRAIVGNAKYTILIGENRYRLKQALIKLNYKDLAVADSLEMAIAVARQKATKGDTVLFSPGFASFDSYANFIERGEAFRNAINNLA